MRLLLLLLGCPALTLAQPRTLTFDRDSTGQLSPTLARHTLYRDGVRGTALDLSARAACRTPLVLDSMSFTANGKQIYGIALWVRTPAGALPGSAGAVIATNVDKTAKAGGFTIGASANGSWYAGFTDNNGNSLWYEPTPARQPLNDGRWHLLALTYSKRLGKARFYYDGQNVAIYNLNELGPINGRGKIRLGGADSTEWNAFNGQIDEFTLYDRIPTPEMLFRLYSSYYTRARLTPLPDSLAELKLMAFNIWHGGRETGAEVGPQRVADLIRRSGADVVGLIETYGSGPAIADALGYYLYLHSSNLSILSRYPIGQTYDFFQPFNCSAARIRVSKTQAIHYINLWLHYLPDTQQQLEKGMKPDSIVAQEWTTRAGELKQILHDADSVGFLSGDVPTFVSGDFNSDSHLDWIRATRNLHRGYVLPWPTSQLMADAGFQDAYRICYPNPKTHPGITWSPLIDAADSSALRYRIDFIYYKGPGVVPREVEVIDTHPIRYPSDHAAVVGTFDLPVHALH